jgi:hypothetical protein
MAKHKSVIHGKYTGIMNLQKDNSTSTNKHYNPSKTPLTLPGTTQQTNSRALQVIYWELILNKQQSTRS